MRDGTKAEGSSADGFSAGGDFGTVSYSQNQWDSAVASDNINDRVYAAQHGNEEVQWELSSDSNPWVRGQVAEHGTEDMREDLSKDNDVYVRTQVAHHGLTHNVKKWFSSEKNPLVRLAARLESNKLTKERQKKCDAYGDSGVKMQYAQWSDDARDVLVYDKDPNVRAAVAEHGNEDQQWILAYDEDPSVRMAVALHGREGHRCYLVHDENTQVAYEATRYVQNSEAREAGESRPEIGSFFQRFSQQGRQFREEQDSKWSWEKFPDNTIETQNNQDAFHYDMDNNPYRNAVKNPYTN